MIPYAERRSAALAAVTDLDTTALLVTSAVHRRYLCGFTGSNGALLITADEVTLATDGRYLEQAAGECPDVRLLDARDCPPALLATIHGTVGFEDAAVTVAEHRRWSESSTVELRPIGDRVQQLRRRKDDTEIQALRLACALTDEAFAGLLQRVGAGWTERQVARELERGMLELGAEALAFDTIVAAGPNGSRPHHTPTDRPIATGELVTCDFGARVDGYHADMTRTFLIGGRAAAWQEDIYQVVRAAQRLGRQALRVGVDLRELDDAARAPIVAAGFGEAYPHGLGHGVGLEIHEAPLIGPSATGTLGEDSVVTVEPGVYLAGMGGVRIEDTLLVTSDGAELLTTSSKELLVV